MTDYSCAYCPRKIKPDESYAVVNGVWAHYGCYQTQVELSDVRRPLRDGRAIRNGWVAVGLFVSIVLVCLGLWMIS